MKNKNQNTNNGLLKKAVFTVLSAGLSLFVSCSNAPVVEPQPEKPNVEKGNIQERMKHYYKEANSASTVEKIKSNFERYNEFEDCLEQNPKFSGLEDDVSKYILSDSTNTVTDAKRAMTVYQRIQDFKNFYNDVLDLKNNNDTENVAKIQKIIENYGNKEFTKLFAENSNETEIEFKFVSEELKNYIENNLFSEENRELFKDLYRAFGDEITSVIESKIYDAALELAQDYNNKDNVAKFLGFLDNLSTLTRANEITGSSYIKAGEEAYNKIKDYVIYTEEEKIGALVKKDTKTLDYYIHELRENNNFQNYKILMDELNDDGSLVNKAINENNVENGINNLRAYLIMKFIEGNEDSSNDRNYEELQKQFEELQKKVESYENRVNQTQPIN